MVSRSCWPCPTQRKRTGYVIEYVARNRPSPTFNYFRKMSSRLNVKPALFLGRYHILDIFGLVLYHCRGFLNLLVEIGDRSMIHVDKQAARGSCKVFIVVVSLQRVKF